MKDIDKYLYEVEERRKKLGFPWEHIEGEIWSKSGGAFIGQFPWHTSGPELEMEGWDKKHFNDAEIIIELGNDVRKLIWMIRQLRRRKIARKKEE